MLVTPIQLAGTIVRLDPLLLSHTGALAGVGLHPELWALQPRAMSTPADMQAYVDMALDEQARGTSLPFVIVRQDSNAVVGSTRYMDIALQHRRLEIGATWLTPSAQGTGANVEAKLLLLTHAFETLAMQKVVLKTETLNVTSRRAILALGAIEEGTFRKHLIADDGRARDMVYFSILDADWPKVKHALMQRLARHERA